MKDAELSFMNLLVIIFALNCSASYAQENDESVFITGRAGSNIGINNCIGSCSADSSGSVGFGFTGHDNSDWDSLILRDSISLDYSRYQFNINGNSLGVDEKAIHFHLESAWQAFPKCVLDVALGPGWSTVSSPNVPNRTVFGFSSEINLLYQVVPSLYVLVGSSFFMIKPANQPDLLSRTVDVGFRWHL